MPTRLVRVPGRVNLLGDHTDYNGLPVFPMAIRQHLQVLMRPRSDGVVRVVNVRPEFPPREFELGETIEPYPQGDWGNYIKAGAEAMWARFGPLCGFDGAIRSEIPIAAGLSSSTALLIAGAVSLVHANRKWLETLEMADLMAKAEHYVGTRGGGMDQAICLAGRSGCAIKIDFDPLRVRLARVPAGWRFVVADSLEQAPKAGAVKEIYNRRVEESRMAAEAVADELGVSRGPRLYARLVAQMSEEDLLFAAGRVLDDSLRRRFRHVVTEARRVERAPRLLSDADARRFGETMAESHFSLRDDYEVSTDTLDRLVEIARDAGALGARLTGAGLGGCMVALVTAEGVDEVLGRLKREFYDQREFSGRIENHLFIAEPSTGSSAAMLAR